MDINVTAIERNLRLYALPGALAVLGLIGVLLIDPSATSTDPNLKMVAPVKRVIFCGAASVAGFGLLWALYNAWLEHRWQQGDLIGGCDHCAGPMRHLNGRYSAYSKCLMCGSKRKGHH